MDKPSNMSSKQNGLQLNTWRLRNRFRLQVLALTLMLASPFTLYWALEHGHATLAVAFFTLIIFSMLLMIWAG